MKDEKKLWTTPTLIEIEKVSATAQCTSGSSETLTCSTGSSTFQCTTGNAATF